MSSNRAKLALDEQSFQGLLAAAFTIQEHNDRKKRGSLNPSAFETVRAIKETGQAIKETVQTTEQTVQASTVQAINDVPHPAEPPAAEAASAEPALPEAAAAACSQCGSPLSTGSASCPNCDASQLRPGERLQRNWASMWLMSQEKALWPAQSEGEGNFPLSPADPALARQKHFDPDRSLRITEAPSIHPVRVREESGDFTTDDLTNVEPAADASSVHVPVEDETSADVRDDPIPDFLPWKHEWPSEISGDGERAGALETLSLNEEAASAEDESALAPASEKRSLRDLRVKLRFHRADLYLGVAILIAVIALLWPAAVAQRPTLRPWERILIAMGIAEAPTPAVHYHGDPNLKVWVDTHTALYYCPGDELYGKSPDGHYSTQREAQSDRFEPAERSVCIQ